MARFFDSDDDIAAPIVPEERANAAVSGSPQFHRNDRQESRAYVQEVFLPKLGPEIC